MDFSDAAPWDETLKNDSDDDNTEAPSFSTPAKPVSEATGFMKKVFGGQFQKSKNVENKKEEERIREREEIENLKRELENQKSELKVFFLNSFINFGNGNFRYLKIKDG